MLTPKPTGFDSRCRELEARLRAGEGVTAEQFVRAGDGPEEVVELAYAEFVGREERGDRPDPEEYLARFPAVRAELQEQFLVHWALAGGTAESAPTQGQWVGPYLLGREIGRGGRAAVFAARDRRDGRAVALKLLLSGEYSTADELALFRHEAAVLARLDHPNLIQLFEAGVADGRPYLALEQIDGTTLAEAVARYRTPESAATLVETLARAADHAHSRGVVHRDIKPSNILLSGDQVKLGDFGLARLLEAGSGRTRTGHIVGTLAYMAPEQAAGAAHTAGPAADVYALGAVLYTLLTGHPPFGPVPSAATLNRLLHEPPPAPRRLNALVPRDLETVVLKCLEKRPAARYPSALALASDLARFLAGKPVAARRVGAVRATLRYARRRPTATALVAVGSVAAAGLVVGGLYYHGRLGDVLSESDRLRRQTAQANSHLESALADVDALRTDTRRQMDETRRVMYANQLAQVPALWQREPIRTRQLLADRRTCPPELTDFTWRHFNALCRLDEWVAQAHPAQTNAIAVLADGRILTGGDDGKLCYWDRRRPPGGQRTLSAQAHAGPVVAIAALDGGRLATAGGDRAVRLWRVGQSSPDREVTLASKPVAARADPAGGRLAVASADGTLEIFDGRTLARLGRRSESPDPVHALAWHPDGRSVATGDAAGRVRLWDAAAGASPRGFDGGVGPVLALAFSPDGRELALAGERGGVGLCELATGKVRRLRGHLMPVRDVAYSPAGDQFATAGDDTYLKIWDAATAAEVTNLMGYPVKTVAWHPDGGSLVGGGRGGRVSAFRTPAVRTPVAHPQASNVAALAPRPGPVPGLVTSDPAGVVRVWRDGLPDPEAELAVLPLGPGPARFRAVAAVGAPPVAVSPDGTLLAVGSGAGEVLVYDLAAHAEVARFAAHAENVQSLAFAPDNRLATGGQDGAIRLWDAAWRRQSELPGHPGGVLALAWSADGTRLASGGEDNHVRLWQPPDGRPEREFAGHDLWVLSVAFHPDGRTLASGSRDRTARVWDVAGVRPPVVVMGHTNWVHSVSFSADGRTLATASGHYSIDSPSEVKLCDPKFGYVRAILTGVRSPAAFDPAADRLYVSTPGGVAVLRGE